MTRRKRWKSLAAAALLVAVASPPTPLPASDAGEREPHDDLGWTVGTWQGFRQDGADGNRAPMTLRVETILAGAGLMEHLEVTHEGGVYRGLSVTVYDIEAGTWVRQYVNSTRGRFVRLEGEVDGDRSTWRSTTPGRTRESRLVSERLDGGRWRRTQQVSEDGGETWRILWRDELDRVPEP